jgi:hypothetical protein
LYRRTQRCPSGKRLLVLLVVHIAILHHVFPLWQWMVWDPPTSWLEDEDDDDDDDDDDEEVAAAEAREAAAGVSGGGGWRDGGVTMPVPTTAEEEEAEAAAAEVATAAIDARYHGAKGCGTLSQGRWHVPSASFMRDCLPIFEQYSQTHMLWNPTEDTVCYPVRHDTESIEFIEVGRCKLNPVNT